jgi:nucleoid-associated protein YgaU
MGETLGTISSDKYGTPVKWRKIYDNNRPLIKNPNTIYAGFTLYYIPEREIASEK